MTRAVIVAVFATACAHTAQIVRTVPAAVSSHFTRPADVLDRPVASTVGGHPRPVKKARRVRSSPPALAPVAPPLNWHALAVCESTDNPRAVDPSGRYFGLFQFDLTTWRSVGGTGTPAEASRGRQLALAEVLYAARGRAPWPVCGRVL